MLDGLGYAFRTSPRRITQPTIYGFLSPKRTIVETPARNARRGMVASFVDDAARMGFGHGEYPIIRDAMGDSPSGGMSGSEAI